LRGVGVPEVLLRLLRDLHGDTGARVRIGGKVTGRFCTTSGVRQGCVLAPALFCRAIDWIMENVTCLGGVRVGGNMFTDLDYADDIVLPVDSCDDLVPCLADFSQSAGSMGLKVSWSKTKVQCLGRAVSQSGVFVEGQGVESVIHFCYLGSVQDSDGRSYPDILRRIGIASSQMNSLSRVWSHRKLSLSTKLRIYQTCILPIALYGSESWTLLFTDSKRLQAFHMRCQRRILGVKWQDRVTNVSVAKSTGLPQVADIINTRRTALFGHVVRLADRTPAHRALRIAVDARSGQHPSPSWRRPRGRARDTWLRPLMKSDTPIQMQWDNAVLRGHGHTAQRLSPDMRL